MRAPAFWDRKISVAGSLLSPLSAVWGFAAARRMGRPRVSPPIPILCVGNFVTGGSGKTPVAMRLAELLAAAGYSPYILSRGYRGALSGRSPLLVDPGTHTAADVGDEPLLLARDAQVVVGSDRRASSEFAAGLGARALIMDDGFQSAAMEMASLIVVDGVYGLGNGRVLPAGPLRAPMWAQWPRASALLTLGEGGAGDALATEAERWGLPTFRGRLQPVESAAPNLRGARVLAFAGIGRPVKFFETLERLGAVIAVRRAFPDHHAYVVSDVRRITESAKSAAVDMTVTTEKDMQRLQALRSTCPEISGMLVLPVRVALEDQSAFSAWLSRAMREQNGNSDLQPT